MKTDWKKLRVGLAKEVYNAIETSVTTVIFRCFSAIQPIPRAQMKDEKPNSPTHPPLFQTHFDSKDTGNVCMVLLTDG